MTKTFVRFFILLLLFAPAALGEKINPWEIYAGYSVQHANVRQYYKSTPTIYTFREHFVKMPGWEVSVTENVNDWIGGILQLSGHYLNNDFVLGTKNRQSEFSILYGPRVSHRISIVVPFGYVLFGAAHASTTVSPGPHAEETAFAVAGGGGVDVKLGSTVGVRPLQVQYSPKNVIGSQPNKYQVSAGVVFYLGTPK